jgi:hypothetical protein
MLSVAKQRLADVLDTEHKAVGLSKTRYRQDDLGALAIVRIGKNREIKQDEKLHNARKNL